METRRAAPPGVPWTRRGDGPLRILFHDPVEGYFVVPEAERRAADGSWEVVYDRALLPVAEVVVFHLPNLRPLRPVRRPGQVWVGWSLESAANYPLLDDAAFMSAFDLTLGYRQDADVWWPYVTPAWAEACRTRPPDKTEGAPAVFFCSNPVIDRSGRLGYVRELMRHLPVDSYGSALPNRRLAHDVGAASKLETIARYRFTLAFENSIAPDYVTEKLYEPLQAGSVPVYLGAPNVDELVPGERCLIDVRGFAGPRELAAHLRGLCADEARYQEHLAWKQRPLRPAFLARLERVRRPLFERLAAAVRALPARRAG